MGFLTQGDLATNLGIVLSTVSNFINSKSVYISTFEQICEKLNLDKREILKPINSDSDTSPEDSTSPQGFYAYDNAWVGREKLVAELSQKLRGSCRLLLILGLTGIGKTALAERLAVQLQDWFSGDWKNKLRRANFDYEDKATDFAVSLLDGWKNGGRDSQQRIKNQKNCCRD
jgi:DNA-binding Xre family transcriptional regulator